MDIRDEIQARVVRSERPLPRDVVRAVLIHLSPKGEELAKKIVADLVPVDNR